MIALPRPPTATIDALDDERPATQIAEAFGRPWRPLTTGSTETASRLVRWLNRFPTTLDNESRGRITAAVTRRESWDGGHRPAPEVDQAAFADLRREINVARHVRDASATATLLGILTIAGTFAINAYSTLLG